MNPAGLAIALFLAVFPLLPAGPGYFGVVAGYGVDAAVGVLVVIWIVLRLTRLRGGTLEPSSGRAVLYAWLVLIVAVTGALVVALDLEMRPGSQVSAAQLAGLPWRILQPVDFTYDPLYPVRVWLTFLEGFLAFAIIRDCGVRSESPRQFARLAAWGLLAGLAIVSALALFQYETRFQLNPLWVARNPALVRAHATFEDPNALGSYLVLCAGLAFGVALSEQRRWAVIAATTVGVMASAAVVATASRAALIALPVSALVILAFAPKPAVLPQAAPTVARGMLAAAAVVGVLTLMARLVVEERIAPPPTTPVEAVIQTFDPRVPVDQVFRDRLVLWSAAARIARLHPIAGIGLGRYPREAPGFHSEWIPFENTHNFFLQLLAEAGLVGLLAFLALWGVAIRALWRGASFGDRADAGLVWGSQIGVLAFSLTLLTSHPLVAPSGQVMLGAVLALTLVSVRSQRPSASTATASIRTISMVASMFAICVYAVAAWRLPPRPWTADPWGYSWGLFVEERGYFPTAWQLPVPSGAQAPGPPGTRAAVFRWTGSHALVELAVPPQTKECVLPFASSLPTQVKGGKQSITYGYGPTHGMRDVINSDLQSIQIPLTPDLLDAGRWLLVRIDVSPAFVPASVGASTDRRKLGVMLFLPRCR